MVSFQFGCECQKEAETINVDQKKSENRKIIALRQDLYLSV